MNFYRKRMLQRNHVQTTANEESKLNRFDELHDELGYKTGTRLRTGKFSIQWYENGAIIKPYRQDGIILTNQELRDLQLMLKSKIDQWDMMKEL